MRVLVLFQARQRAPQVVVLQPRMLLPLGLARRLFLVRDRRGPLVAIDPVVRQRMAGIQHGLDRVDAVAVLAGHDVLAREHQVVQHAVGVGPLAEQIVALEEGVVAVAGVRDHQRLHRHGVFFHEIRDAGIGIDHDLIGQSLHAAPVELLVADEFLAVGPVRITDRQARRGIGIKHLLRGDDLDLVRVGVQPVLARDLRDRVVIGLQQLERPFGALRDRPRASGRIRLHECTHDGIHTVSFLNRSWNTG